MTVAVLVYAPQPGAAGVRRAEATAALVAAERANGADVVEGDALALAAAALAAGWVDERQLAFFARGAQLVTEGRRALAHVELERAESLLGEAERVYAPELWRPGARTEAATAALWHGVALFELGTKEEAQRAWRRALALEPATLLTEAMVRPDVTRAFATARAAKREEVHVERPAEGAAAAAIAALHEAPSLAGVEALRTALGVDEVLVVAIASDAGVLTYAATRRPAGCGTETVTSVRAGELVKRLGEATCLAEERVAVLEAPAIAHPRPLPSLVKGGGGGAGGERRARLWQKPWLWVGVVGALGLGVVLAVNLWPRDATYSANVEYGQFALGRR